MIISVNTRYKCKKKIELKHLCNLEIKLLENSYQFTILFTRERIRANFNSELLETIF